MGKKLEALERIESNLKDPGIRFLMSQAAIDRSTELISEIWELTGSDKDASHSGEVERYVYASFVYLIVHNECLIMGGQVFEYMTDMLHKLGVRFLHEPYQRYYVRIELIDTAERLLNVLQ